MLRTYIQASSFIEQKLQKWLNEIQNYIWWIVSGLPNIFFAFGLSVHGLFNSTSFWACLNGKSLRLRSPVSLKSKLVTPSPFSLDIMRLNITTFSCWYVFILSAKLITVKLNIIFRKINMIFKKKSQILTEISDLRSLIEPWFPLQPQNSQLFDSSSSDSFIVFWLLFCNYKFMHDFWI